MERMFDYMNKINPIKAEKSEHEFLCEYYWDVTVYFVALLLTVIFCLFLLRGAYMSYDLIFNEASDSTHTLLDTFFIRVFIIFFCIGILVLPLFIAEKLRSNKRMLLLKYCKKNKGYKKK